MLIIKIKTWCCKDCGYQQDCEPTKEMMDKHFNKDKDFRINDVQENECPCCCLEGKRGVQMVKETDPKKKTEMAITDSQSDIDKQRSELEAEGTNKFAVGKEIRLETDEEKIKRIDIVVIIYDYRFL